MHSPRGILAALSLVAILLLAGCVTGPNQEACAGPVYETVHYAEVLDPDRLREGFLEAGYEWGPGAVGNNTAEVTPPRTVASGVRIVLALEPGPSAAGPTGPRGTVMTIEETREIAPGAGRVHNVARHAVGVVNATFPDAERPIDRWFTGTHEPAGC